MKLTILKILVVLLLIASAATAALGYRVYQQRVVLKENMMALRTGAVETAASLHYEDTQFASSLKDAELTTPAMKKLGVHAAQIYRENKNLTDNAKTLKEKLAFQEERVSATQTQLAERETRIRSLQTEVDQLKALAAKDQTRKHGLQSEILDLKTKNQQLTEKVMNLEDDVPQYEDDLAALKAENDRVWDKLMACEGVGQNARPEEQIAAKVVSVDSEWNFVVLDAGENKAMKKGYEAVVHREDKYIGKVKVSKVDPDSAIAEIQPQWTNRAIEPGDKIFIEGSGVRK